ncbi:hypothetical protein IFM46972_09280, partial [Aspergillus udagawae]
DEQYKNSVHREKLELIAGLGLKHIEDKKAKVKLTILGHLVDAQDGVGTIGEANPAAIDAANREGLAYDTSQLHYYVETESLLLPNNT